MANNHYYLAVTPLIEESPCLIILTKSSFIC